MATVRIYKIALSKKAKGIASKLIKEVLLETEVEAKVITAGGPYSTGALSDSIYSEGPFETVTGVRGSVGSRLSYALVAHQGAKVHAIFPKGAVGVYRFNSRRKPQLHFFWRKVGKAVWLPHIPGSPTKIGRSHPGMKGLHYLTEPMRRAARRHSFRAIIYDV
jgi:hypothetical protein